MIRVIENKIAIDPMFSPGFSPSGLLIIPEEAKDRCTQGIVKYIGPDVREYKVGDYVLFPGYSGTLMRLEGEGLLILMREEFITCRIDPVDTDIPGLYFIDREGNYWPASYEQSTTLIARRFEELQLVQNVKHMDKLISQRAGS